MLATLALTLGPTAGCGGGGGDTSAVHAGNADLSGTVHIWDTNYESFPGYPKVMNRLDAEFEKENRGVTIDREAQPIDTSPVVFGPMTKGVSEVLQGRMSLAEAREGMQEAVEKTEGNS